VSDPGGRLLDSAAWLTVQETLWAIVNRAYPGSLLAERFIKGNGDIPASVRFQGSATEQEIWRGALRVSNAREHVVAWFREIDRTGRDPEPAQLKRFIDLRSDGSPDVDAASALSQLKIQVEETLATEPVFRAVCRWEKKDDGKFTGNVTTDHLGSMCEAFLTRLRAIVLRQINDYWSADLSAQDASVAAVRGSQQELDRELLDHLRFGQERGPVDLFVGRDAQVRTIREYLQSTINRPLIMHGPSGSGKTALLAYVAQRPFLHTADLEGVSPLILTRFIGAHPESSTLRGLMTSLCRELRVHFPIVSIATLRDTQQESGPEPLPGSVIELTKEFYAQLGRATKNRPIYVFLDAVDQLEATDEARYADWLRTMILQQADSTQCNARIVASCLAPSDEFSMESDACEPYRNLQSRGLLVDSELEAIDEANACQLVRQWLADRQRDLSEKQWESVDAAIRNSSACRQPLYLKVLCEQLVDMREFDIIYPIPTSLSQLIQQTLARLCQPNQHRQLPRIALGYLVSTRYGLAEGELLEVLFRDPEINAQLDADRTAHGHELPDGCQSFPIAPWARLRSDLRVFLSERAAPGTIVLYCYHRQVEQAVRTLFLGAEVTRTRCWRHLADYFDGRWDNPDAHALMELPELLLTLKEHRQLYDRLTNFAFPMRKAELGLLESIPDDYRRLGTAGPADILAPLHVWQDFFREQAHILRRGIVDQSVHNNLMQLAMEHADDSQVTKAAEVWLSAGHSDWFHLRRSPRRQQLIQNQCSAVLEGHTNSINGALVLPDDRIVSWSSDNTLRLWNPKSGACQQLFNGHTESVTGALLVSDGRLLSWSHDETLRLWDLTTGECCAILHGHTEWITGAIAMPHDRVLSWSNDYTLRIWDTATGTCCRILEDKTNCVQFALLLPEDRILSWSYDKTLQLWDATTGSCSAVLEGHTAMVLGARLLPDGQILSWSADNTMRLWNAATGVCQSAMKDGKPYWGAILLPDSKILSWGGVGCGFWTPCQGSAGYQQTRTGVLLRQRSRVPMDEYLVGLRAWMNGIIHSGYGKSKQVFAVRSWKDTQSLSMEHSLFRIGRSSLGTAVEKFGFGMNPLAPARPSLKDKQNRFMVCFPTVVFFLGLGTTTCDYGTLRARRMAVLAMGTCPKSGAPCRSQIGAFSLGRGTRHFGCGMKRPAIATLLS